MSERKRKTERGREGKSVRPVTKGGEKGGGLEKGGGRERERSLGRRERGWQSSTIHGSQRDARRTSQDHLA